MHFKPSRCWIRLKNLDLMHVSVAPAEMKKKQGPKKEFFQYVMNSVSGIPKDRDLNYGISTTAKFKKVKTSGYFPSATGQNSIFGITYVAKKLICQRFIFPMKEM